MMIAGDSLILNEEGEDSQPRDINENNVNNDFSPDGNDPDIEGRYVSGGDSDNSPVNIVVFPFVNNTTSNSWLQSPYLPRERPVLASVQLSETDDARLVVSRLRAELDAAIEAPTTQSTAGNLNYSSQHDHDTSSSTISRGDYIDSGQSVNIISFGNSSVSVTSSTTIREEPTFQMIPVLQKLCELHSVPKIGPLTQRCDEVATAMGATVTRRRYWTLKDKVMHLYREENFDLNQVIQKNNTGTLREFIPVLRFIQKELEVSELPVDSTIDDQVLAVAEILGIQDECKRLDSTRQRTERVWRELNFPLQTFAPSNNLVYVSQGRVQNLRHAVDAIKRELELDEAICKVPDILAAALNTITIMQDIFEGPNDTAKAIAQELGIITTFE